MCRPATLAEEVEDPTAVTRRSQEPTNKQTPVIKGVLPDAPAPQAAPLPEAQAEARAPARTPAASRCCTPAGSCTCSGGPQEQGFFAWLKGLFGMGGPPAWPRTDPSTRCRNPQPASRAVMGVVVKAEAAAAGATTAMATATLMAAMAPPKSRARRGERSERPSEARPTEGGGRPPREGRDSNRENWPWPPGRRRSTPVADAQTQAATASAPQGMDAA